MSLPDPGSEPTIDGHRAAELWGVSYWTVLEMAKEGTAPVAPLRLGRKLRWPTVLVLRSVGLAPTDDPSAEATL